MKQVYDKDQVRMMVADLGYRETSQRLNIPAPTLRQWAHRFKWSVPVVTDERVTLVTRPVVKAHNEALADLETETRLSLARSARRMAKDCEELPAREAKTAHTVAQTMAIVHRQGENSGSVQFSLNVLNLNMFSEGEEG